MSRINLKISYTSLSFFLLPGATIGEEASTEEEQQQENAVETVYILGRSDGMRTEPGSAHAIDEAELEQFEYNNIHRILSQVPGVNFREEDGYGLRPNIGIRGAASERSQKIALMQDGFLIAPAPYSAPSAYYFPLVTRMQAVEVYKGPATIKYGPNTIGGAINLVSRTVPDTQEGLVDLVVGQDDMVRLHSYVGDSYDNWGWLLEGAHWQTAGFKQLPDASETGFDKSEVSIKSRWNTDLSAAIYQQVDIAIAISEELSNETYLGLTDDDFDADPVRRYPASQLDEMDWDHSQVFLTHLAQWQNDLSLVTKVYRLDFQRDWQKLNRFNSEQTLQAILADPSTGINAIFYDVLTGVQDSANLGTVLRIGTNSREYYSQGISFDLSFERNWLDWQHNLSFGLRFHQDQIQRHHFEEGYNMRSARLVADGNGEFDILINKDSASSIALFAQNEINIDKLTVTLGLRSEIIESEAEQSFPTSVRVEDDYNVILPGVGVFYSLSDNFGILGGVYRGFVPNKPGQDDVDPELSVNYEFGFRSLLAGVDAEMIAFFSDYSNLVGVCTFSSGCTEDVDAEFNGGEVEIKGIELSLGHRFGLTDSIQLPAKLVYTHTQSEFQTSFESSFSQWGEVSAGDELPYLPENQLTLSLGVVSDNWRVELAGKYISEMQETAGITGTALDDESTDELWLWDLSSNYQWNDELSIYLTVDNVFDEQAIVSRRPFGARPSKPLSAMLGAKYSF